MIVEVVMGIGVVGVIVGAVVGLVKLVRTIDAPGRAAAQASMGDYKAVIQDIISMKGYHDEIKLFLRIETPNGPIGEYLIVPLAPPSTMTFLQDARATQRAIMVRCSIDRSVDYAYRQRATVLGLA